MRSLISLKRITRFSYLLGIACLLVGITFSFVPPPGEAATVNGLGNCSEGFITKDSNAPFKYTGDQNVCKVIVKAGSQNQPDHNACTGITFPPASQTDGRGCYQVSGLGSSSVSVSKVGTDESCKEISHVEFYPCQDEPTPTDPTPTDPTPTDPTPTDPTPTDPTPTDPTPTDPTPTDPTPTEPTETVTPAETETPTDSPETVTPTDPPENVTPTDPPSTPTPPPTLSQPKPQKTDSPPILIPETGVDLSASNQIFGTRFFLFLGLSFIGLGMIFQGVSNRRTRNEPQE